jgi:predicted RNase H-like nuclease (RuvC/YqgF family)
VELRRQLNNEKKRALEQSELMSQAKEQLERENHRQQTQILEKEDHIRQLTQELRNNEKKIYDI